MKHQIKFYAAASAAFAILLLCLAPLNAQQTRGVVLGRVSDQSAAVVPDAQVTLLNEKTGISSSVTTGAQGDYTFTNVEPGNYRVTVAGKGFKTSAIQNVTVFVAQTVRVDVALEVGDLATQVEVQATVSVVQSETSSVGNVVDGTQVAAMPLNGRSNIMGLMRLAPGVQRGAINPLIAGNDWTGGSNFTFDGVSNNDVLGERGLATVPSLDSIGEFKVIANGASAEYGKGSAQVLMVSKAGTNELHGSLLWFNRVRATSAKNFFATGLPKAQFIRNEYGGSLGGPIIKNKTFFFGSFEGLRSTTMSTSTSAMPTAALKKGDFSNLPAIKDPFAGGTPFSDNQIPDSRISPVAKELMKFSSEPNGPGVGAAGLGNNFTINIPTVQPNDRYSIRGDHNFSANDRITGRYFDVSNGPYVSASGGTDKYGNWGGNGDKSRSLMSSYTRILSPAMVNEIKFGYNWNRVFRTPQNPDYDPSKIIPGLIAPYPGLGGLPSVTITGFKAFTEQPGSGGDHGSHEFFDTFSWTRGRHSLKAGVEWQRVRGSNFQNGSPYRGGFNFDGRYSGHPYADFLLGALASSGRANKNPDRRPVNQRWGSFVQDDWNVSPKLTLNIGLRYEYGGLFTNQNRDLSNWDPVTNRIILFDGTPDPRLMATLPVVDAKTAGFAAGRYMNRDFTNFAPRIGFAYRPLGTSRFVVRGSYGLYYNPASANSWGYSVMLNPPFLVSESFEPQPGPVPSLTWAAPFPGSGNIPANPSFSAASKNFQTPYSQQWNLTLEQEVLKNTAVRATYLGNIGLHLPTPYPVNDPPYPAAGALQARRPVQIMGAITMGTTDRTTATHQLQLGATRRFSSGLAFGVEYMWTRALGPHVYGDLPMDYRNIRLDRGNLDFLKRHHASINYVYDLPFGKGQRFLSSLPGAAEKLIGGWQLAGISYLMTGDPYSVTFTSTTLGWPSSRADIVGNPTVSNPSLTQWFNPAAFAVPQPFLYGNSARNMLFGPGQIYWDASVFKSTKLTERLTLQFRAEFFNILNHANFGNPASNISVPTTVGRISSATDPRNMQFGLRLQF